MNNKYNRCKLVIVSNTEYTKTNSKMKSGFRSCKLKTTYHLNEIFK